MIPEFNINIALLTYGVAFSSAYIAVSAAEQLRCEFLKYRKPTFYQMFPYLMMFGVAVGGVSFWGMHAIGMASITLKDDNLNVVPVTYNVGVSVFGILFGFIFKFVGLYVGCKDRLYAKSKTEILEFFVESISMDEIIGSSELRVLFLLATKELKYTLIGGTLAGIGVIGVHFIIIASMEFPGYIVWNGGIIFAAIVVAIGSAVTAYWLLFRLLSIYPDVEFLRLAVSTAGGLCSCVMHYIAILAADFKIDYSKTTQLSWQTGTMNNNDMLYIVLLISMIILWALVMIIFADLRGKINCYRAYLQKLAPNEKLSDLLVSAENGSDGNEASKHQAGINNNGGGGGKKNAVAPATFDEYESPL